MFEKDSLRTMEFFKRKIQFIVPIAYILGAILIWLDFSQTNPDGLANAGIVLYTLPVMFLAMLLISREFPYVEGNYYHAHAVYFIISVVLMAVFLFLVITWLQKTRRGRSILNKS